MTSPLNLNCLKFNNQSSLFLSLFLTYHLLISTIKPTSYLYLSLISSSSSSQKKKKKKKNIIFPPKKLLMFLLLMTSPLNLNCLKFNNQSSLFLSLSLTYHLLISNIKPTSYLYLSLNSSSSSSQKKKKKPQQLPTKKIANVSPINDFTIKSQLP